MTPQDSSRVVALVAFSIAGGAVIGATAATSITPIGLVFGLAFGAIVGCMVSPIIVITLFRKHLGFAIPAVLVPAVIVALIAGQATNIVVTLLSVVVFCAVAAASYLALPHAQRGGPHDCLECGYDITGLSRCPECGYQAGSSSWKSLPRAPRVAGAIVIVVIGFVIPLLLASYAAYERHRPRSADEWIGLLGSHDVQMQGEARQALIEHGADPLIRALSHWDPTVRRNAALALESLADPAAREALVAALDDSDPEVRDRAAAALEAIGP
ncbi:MAG: HEAT repeat domain-containing protein [Phycisphaerales bacterium JB039]